MESRRSSPAIFARSWPRPCPALTGTWQNPPCTRIPVSSIAQLVVVRDKGFLSSKSPKPPHCWVHSCSLGLGEEQMVMGQGDIVYVDLFHNVPFFVGRMKVVDWNVQGLIRSTLPHCTWPDCSLSGG